MNSENSLTTLQDKERFVPISKKNSVAKVAMTTRIKKETKRGTKKKESDHRKLGVLFVEQIIFV
jgi:hypothetical protein